jgi:hypothetical protein
MATELGDKGPTIIIVTWALTSIALILVIARVYTRLVVLKTPGADDYLITLSMVQKPMLNTFLVFPSNIYR